MPPSPASHPVNEFILELLPEWLKSAGELPLKAFHSCLKAHLDSQKQIASVISQLVPLQQFAKARLGPAIEAKLGVPIDLDTAIWREAHLRVSPRPFDPTPGVLPPDFDVHFTFEPLLQKLLQNFSAGESFTEQTTVLAGPPEEGLPEQPVTSKLQELVALCRAVDVGGAYQEHLGQLMNKEFIDTLALDKRLELALAVETAALKGQLAGADLAMLRQAAQGHTYHHAQGWSVVAKALQVLDCRVDGALVFELFEPPRHQGDFPFGPPNALKGVILYLPGLQEQPLRRFTNWAAVNKALVAAMADSEFKRTLLARIALNERSQYQLLLSCRLGDDLPDLQPWGVPCDGSVFAAMADWHVQRIKDDARFLAVPSALADRAATARRLAGLKDAGLALIGLAGLFVPVVGAVLLADMARQLLGHVYQGASDWSQGHQHEALQHLIDVATSVALLGTAALGAHVLRNAFFEPLEPVMTEQGLQRLWRNDLEPYRKAPADLVLTERHDGLFAGGDQLWWHNEGRFYAVRQDAKGAWRLLHDEGPGAFGPALRGNGERAWWLGMDRPLEWQGEAFLLRRLWPAARLLSAERVADILRVADVDEAVLRRLLVEQRPLPVALRDTLERFAVQARNDSFFRLQSEGEVFIERLQWCSEQLGVQALVADERITAAIDNAERLRPAMLEHFAGQYGRDDPALPLLARHFPSLPKAYALEVLKAASPQMRDTILHAARLPLALAQRARMLMQEVRLVRLREALYLRDSYSPDLVSLVFKLLQKQGLAREQTDLVFRGGAAVLEHLCPAFGGAASRLDMVWKNGRFELYDAIGHRSELDIAEPQGLFEVLAATLAPSYLQKMGWDAEGTPGRIRAQMQAWLPQARKDLLALLGWHESRPRGALLQRLDDGRIGYPLGPVQSCLGSEQCPLRRRIRSLYPGFSDADVEQFRILLYERTTSPYDSLLRQEREYDRLDQSLSLWSQHADAFQHEQRVRASDAFRRAWRMEGLRLPVRGMANWDSPLSLVSMPLDELPEIPAGTDFGHISQITLVNLRVGVLPAGFLANFPRLRILNLNYNNLLALPEGLERLPHLRELSLVGNRIRLTAEQMRVLANCRQLRNLDLSDNFIGATALQVQGLENLETLNLRRTGLRAFPDGLERCTRLTYIDVRNNQIDHLPQALLTTPLLQRQVIALSGNPVSPEQLQRLRLAHPPALVVEPAPTKSLWLGTLANEQRQTCEAQWDALCAEAGSEAFFDLLDGLTESADFRAIPEELGRQVWEMIAAARSDSRLRQDLFDLAADPRTCADSAAHIFSQLQVAMHVSPFTRNGDAVATAPDRLLLAQRLFRLQKVQDLARDDIDARYADGRWQLGEQDEEEVEVSLVYRTALAERLNLLGQPRGMLFAAVERVEPDDIEKAFLDVLDAENTEERTLFISKLDFWVASLRALHAEAFKVVEEDFAAQWDALEARMEKTGEAVESHEAALGNPEYLAAARLLGDNREQALAELSLRLTREALQVPA